VSIFDDLSARRSTRRWRRDDRDGADHGNVRVEDDDDNGQCNDDDIRNPAYCGQRVVVGSSPDDNGALTRSRRGGNDAR